MQNRTSIVIAHRLTTVEKCNRIAVIEGGKIVEEGKFDELRSKQEGFFSTLAAGMEKKALKEEKKQKRMSMMSERESFMERMKSSADPPKTAIN